MNVKVSEATEELKKLYQVLAEDVEEARVYGQTSPTGFAHRSLFRAAFALIEGLSSKFRMVSVACADAMPTLLTRTEVSLLKQEKYKLNDKGQPRVSPEYQRLLPNLLFSMRCYAKVHGAKFEPETSHHGYGSLTKFVAVRNAIEHPKSAVDLELTEEKLHHAMEGMKWWKREVLRLLETCREADDYWQRSLT